MKTGSNEKCRKSEVQETDRDIPQQTSAIVSVQAAVGGVNHNAQQDSCRHCPMNGCSQHGQKKLTIDKTDVEKQILSSQTYFEDGQFGKRKSRRVTKF